MVDWMDRQKAGQMDLPKDYFAAEMMVGTMGQQKVHPWESTGAARTAIERAPNWVGRSVDTTAGSMAA